MTTITDILKSAEFNEWETSEQAELLEMMIDAVQGTPVDNTTRSARACWTFLEILDMHVPDQMITCDAIIGDDLRLCGNHADWIAEWSDRVMIVCDEHRYEAQEAHDGDHEYDQTGIVWTPISNRAMDSIVQEARQ